MRKAASKPGAAYFRGRRFGGRLRFLGFGGSDFGTSHSPQWRHFVALTDTSPSQNWHFRVVLLSSMGLLLRGRRAGRRKERLLDEGKLRLAGRLPTNLESDTYQDPIEAHRLQIVCPGERSRGHKGNRSERKCGAELDTQHWPALAS